eukprot:1560491-Pleurochrysis_carterae.AAC.1
MQVTSSLKPLARLYSSAGSASPCLRFSLSERSQAISARDSLSTAISARARARFSSAPVRSHALACTLACSRAQQCIQKYLRHPGLTSLRLRASSVSE